MSMLINKKRLNTMQAWIKEYNDGTEILQSYQTDVVKRTPYGQYIRLWNGWSVSTSKQVFAWCGHCFRDLPFADGTVEDRSRKNTRTGYLVTGYPTCINDYSHDVDETFKYLSRLNNEELLSGRWIHIVYNTSLHKRLKDFIKGNKDLTELIMIAKACALGNKEKRLNRAYRVKTSAEVIAKFYNYDFDKIVESYQAKSKLIPEEVHVNAR